MMADIKRIREKCKEIYVTIKEIKEIAERNSTGIYSIFQRMDELYANKDKNCEDVQENLDVSVRMTEYQVRLQEGMSRLENAGSIKREHLEECIVLADRKDALELIPKNGVAAEVGVAYGDFSEKIISKCKPKKFYAIDYFSQEDPYCNFWGQDLFRKDNMPHQQWYEHRFSSLISKGLMEIRQGFSWDVLSEFENNYFDYVYLDAAHDYESVRKDISVLKDKVKNGGYIQFNDYTVFSILEDAFYGVVPAVNGFINQNGSKHQVKAICLQQNGYFDLLVQVIK